MRIIVDFNNLAVRHWCIPIIESETDKPNVQLWKFNVIESIYSMICKHDNVTEVILAVDSKDNWRKLYWPRYKESRKLKREKSKTNWRLFYNEFEKFTKEIAEYLPFKVIKVHGAEGDDIASILATNGSEAVIVSTDEDYVQLSDKVRIYNPVKGDYIKCDDVEKFLQIKSLTGQAKDDIFNIKTPLNHPFGKRKPGFGEISAKKVIESGLEQWLKKENLEERYKFNRVLIDFSKIPNTIKNRVMKAYNQYKLANPDNIYKFFHNNNFRYFLENYNAVEEKLMKLY